MSKKNIKVVTAEEMARIDQLAIASGCNEEAFIDQAGKKIAVAAAAWIEKKKSPKTITLLVGKGNNGADAYAAGIHLLRDGFQVTALVLYTKGSVFNEKFKQTFLSENGKVQSFSSSIFFDALILDGLLGTGFKGAVDDLIGSVISQANESGRDILSIDIPSGLNGTTGESSQFVICASQTVTLGLPKTGLFLKDGWRFVGDLKIESFGMSQAYIEKANPTYELLNEQSLKLPPLIRNRHKYEAGYVLGLSGSDRFKGAPQLSGLASLRSGAGIVRIFHLEEIGPAPKELICEKWDADTWEQELKRADSLFLGPGLGSKVPSFDLKKMKIPCVIDADFLQVNMVLPEQAILTPHRGEMIRLLGLDKIPEEDVLFSLCQKFVDEKQIVLVLKGAPTFLFCKGKLPLIVARGDPGMATAGAGDVLTGILAALLAQKMGCYEAAELGIYLHAKAGEEAALEKTSYSMIASDLIEKLPKAFQWLLSLNQSINREIPSSKET
jgi:NAD(P)H-hydrate epimerase